MSSSRTADVETARFLLRHAQQRWAEGVLIDPDEPTTGQVAGRMLAERIAGARTDGEWVHDGVFRYEARTETMRWKRTYELIARTDPGPHEDGRYLEMLARQAASVELAILSNGLLADPEALDGVLLGTTGEPLSQAYTSSVAGSRAATVCLSAGMVYLMYQAAKAVVLSWLPREPPAGSAVSFSSRLEDTVELLNGDDRPVAQLTDTLLTWFATGLARPAESTAPAVQYHPPLTLLTSFAERFVIAHEYGHVLYDVLRQNPPPWLEEAPTTPIAKELRADRFATVMVCASAVAFDQMAPNMALQGAMLAMRVHEVAEAAIEIVTGRPAAAPSAHASHPPFAERVEAAVRAYADAIADAEDDRLAPEAVLVPVRTLDELWRRTRPRVERFAAGRGALSPIWQAR